MPQPTVIRTGIAATAVWVSMFGATLSGESFKEMQIMHDEMGINENAPQSAESEDIKMSQHLCAELAFSAIVESIYEYNRSSILNLLCMNHTSRLINRACTSKENISREVFLANLSKIDRLSFDEFVIQSISREDVGLNINELNLFAGLIYISHRFGAIDLEKGKEYAQLSSNSGNADAALIISAFDALESSSLSDMADLSQKLISYSVGGNTLGLSVANLIISQGECFR